MSLRKLFAGALWLLSVAGLPATALADRDSCVAQAEILNAPSIATARDPRELHRLGYLKGPQELERVARLCLAAVANDADPKLRLMLGRQYAALSWVSPDRSHAEAARLHLEAAAKAGEPEAFEEFALLYENFFFDDPSAFPLVAEWLQKGAGRGSAFANAHLGYRRAYGIGAPRTPGDCRQAIQYFDQALRDMKTAPSDRSHGAIYSRIAVTYRDAICRERDQAEAIRLLREGARLGSARAMLNLAAQLETLGPKDDDKEVLDLLFRAASKGDSGALHNVGMRFIQGRGVPQDHVMARRWLEEAALRQDTRAMIELSKLVAAGQSTDGEFRPDADRARSLRRQARATALRWAEYGDGFAMVHLAELLWNGIGGPQDRLGPNGALQWSQRAADLGANGGANILGNFYRELGRFKEAIASYEKGMRLGDSAATANLGDHYCRGLGVMPDCTKGMELLRAAAARGNSWALYRTAEFLFARTDFAEARRHFDLAIERHSTDAMLRLAGLFVDRKDRLVHFNGGEAAAQSLLERAGMLGSSAALAQLAAMEARTAVNLPQDARCQAMRARAVPMLVRSLVFDPNNRVPERALWGFLTPEDCPQDVRFITQTMITAFKNEAPGIMYSIRYLCRLKQPCDRPEIVKLLTESAATGFWEAGDSLARFIDPNLRAPDSVKILERFAEQSEPSAQLLLGVQMLRSTDPTVVAKGLEHIKASADQGQRVSIDTLIAIYSRNSNIGKSNCDLALQYFEKKLSIDAVDPPHLLRRPEPIASLPSFLLGLLPLELGADWLLRYPNACSKLLFDHPDFSAHLESPHLRALPNVRFILATLPMRSMPVRSSHYPEAATRLLALRDSGYLSVSCWLLEALARDDRIDDALTLIEQVGSEMPAQSCRSGAYRLDPKIAALPPQQSATADRVFRFLRSQVDIGTSMRPNQAFQAFQHGAIRLEQQKRERILAACNGERRCTRVFF